MPTCPLIQYQPLLACLTHSSVEFFAFLGVVVSSDSSNFAERFEEDEKRERASDGAHEGERVPIFLEWEESEFDSGEKADRDAEGARDEGGAVDVEVAMHTAYEAEAEHDAAECAAEVPDVSTVYLVVRDESGKTARHEDQRCGQRVVKVTKGDAGEGIGRSACW